MTPPRKAVVVGISGCSSSGKTTLSRLLRDIFPNTFVLHEDDFYKPETELPTKHGLLDWDCAEALSIPDIVKSLQHIHAEGTFPPDLDSKEDRNSVGECPVSDATIAALKERVSAWAEPGGSGHGILSGSNSAVRLCVFDGFLLYSKALGTVQPQIDIKLFLRVSYAKAKARREARSGYVTLEGFWEDPPGYVDKIVWPNYVEDHEWMFEGGDVEGRLRASVLKESGIRSQEGGPDRDMETTLKWAVEVLMEQLPVTVKST
ncbi:nicotinamide riboside kinase 1 [Drepanopeziza brunnea f. sp. 'multigermtubi' MB_m1]|uniref:Nicotinamide riboside kinase 1 n=1 Tax=Marssonina brunnea f. sp. multigermtubi (strain MB_m1) TaxID=1072389 RepID=K1W6U8_MARBU|nr:nicotinamide riboside kinase 1 [Drepanopeziza brunnea f. sp. 'multigermtubi' MB_m1]EKD12740.1 nicotinamide riboside kinase 1 [Drepanopeziza brunnea f. sp. 'multigermtubi' MB_m1]